VSDAVRTIREAVDDLFADTFRDIRSRLVAIQLSGPHRRFLVTRLGSTGSTWLAKLLNSHPDVYCTHEGILGRVFPATSYRGEDVVTLIEALSSDTMHHAYRAAGDVGSVFLHILGLPKGTFATGVLVRHPARVLNRRLAVLREQNIWWELDPSYARCIRHIWDLDVSTWERADQVFVQELCLFALQVYVSERVDVVIPIERMNDVAYCQEVTWKLTGLEYEPALVEPMIGKPVNRQSGGGSKSVRQILDSFNERQRDCYRLMLAGLVEPFGYDLERG
jgi:hypothetical protein